MPKKRTDKERLDWMEAQKGRLVWMSHFFWVVRRQGNFTAGHRTARAAIDAAMSQEAKVKRGRG